MAARDEEMIAEIDLHENAVYRVLEGKLTRIDDPPTGWGEQVIYWQENKPKVWKLSYTGK